RARRPWRYYFFQAEDGIRDGHVTGVQTCALPILNFEGSNPCARCPVPPRNPRTGEIIPGFQKRLSDFRRANLPAWTPESRFDHRSEERRVGKECTCRWAQYH